MLGIFLDTETNGLNAKKHKVLEIAYKIIDLRTGSLKDQFDTVVYQSPEDWKWSDPESLRINGFTWEKVSEGKEERRVAEEIRVSFHRNGIERKGAVFICQNPSFDRTFFSQLIDPDTQEKLLWPYHWLDLASMYWANTLHKGKCPWETGLSKDKIAKSLGLPPEDKPHRAMNGVDHLLLCYKAVVGFPNEEIA